MTEYRHDGIVCSLGTALFSVGRGDNRLFIGDTKEPLRITIEREDSATIESGPFRMNIYFSIHDSVGLVFLMYGFQMLGHMREVSETGIKFLVAVLQGKGAQYQVSDDSDTEYDSD